MQLVTYDGGKQKSMIMQKFKDKVEHEKLSFGWHNYCVTKFGGQELAVIKYVSLSSNIYIT